MLKYQGEWTLSRMAHLYLFMVVWVVLQVLLPANPSASWWSSCGQWRLFVLRLLLLVSSSWLMCCLCWRCKCLIHNCTGTLVTFLNSVTYDLVCTKFIYKIKFKIANINSQTWSQVQIILYLLTNNCERGNFGHYSDWLQARRLGSIPSRCKIFFSSTPSPDRLWSLPSHLSNGYRGSVPGVKRPERKFGHLPPSNAKVKSNGAAPPQHHTSSCRNA
jgi:hypothetical protein